MSFSELMNRLGALEAKMAQMLRVCTVVSVQDGKGTVRVKLPDAGNMVSQPLPVMVRKVQDDKDYEMPDVGEQVLCVFLPFGLEQGFCLGSFYQDVDQPPVADRNKRHFAFKDGTYLEYDRGAHKLTASVQGDIEVTATGTSKIESTGDMSFKSGGSILFEAATQIKSKAPSVAIEGDITATGTGGETGTNSISGGVAVEGDITASGSIIDAGGNTPHHNHV